MKFEFELNLDWDIVKRIARGWIIAIGAITALSIFIWLLYALPFIFSVIALILLIIVVISTIAYNEMTNPYGGYDD